MKLQPNRKHAEAGFSLIELLVSVGILLMLMAGVFSQVAKMQKFSNNEEKKRDMFQNVREALDQMNRDIHAAGYPNKSQYNLTNIYTLTGTNPVPGFTNLTIQNSNLVAAKGFVTAAPDTIMFEGDVDGDGVVDSVAYQYSAAVAGFKCPCLRRGQIQKVNGVAPSAQNTLANMNVVIESLIAPGGTAETSIPPPVFLFYDTAGNVLPGPVAATDLSKVKTVKVNLYAQAVSDTTNAAAEWTGKIRPEAAMTLTAKIGN
jgi:prepilin-type N-terminal cleavage/methylation domain-containing protein